MSGAASGILSRGWLPALAIAGLAASLSACGGLGPVAFGGRPASLPVPDTGSSAGHVAGAQVITYQVVGSEDGALGPDGRRHDTFRATSATTVVAGRPLTIEIQNTDEMPHSFTIAELGIDRQVPAAHDGSPGRVSFSFTPPAAGTYRWFCALPCDQDNGGWDMGVYASTGMMSGGMGRTGSGMMQPGVDGFMAGYITVTSA